MRRAALPLFVLPLLGDVAIAAPPADLDVGSYTLNARLDPALHTIHGTGTIVWKNTSTAPTSELWVHLYLNAFKNQKSAFLREPVGTSRGTGAVGDWGYIDVRKLTLREGERGPVELWPTAELHRPDDDDETDARVPLPRPVAPGETITLDVEWDDKLPTVVERTGYDGTFHFAGQWFPKIARLEPDGRWAHFPFHHLAEFYADYTTFDVTLDVPEGFVIGATGRRFDAPPVAGRRVERRRQANVHDFAWTAWDKFQTMTAKIDGIDVTLLYPPGYRKVAERDMATMAFALPHYEAMYGTYPYDVLTVVHVPTTAYEAGAMEYPTLFTTSAPWYGPPGVLETELVTMHEFGHQYFYGLLASDEVTWPFLDEGLNSYAEQEALGAWRGAGSAVDLLGLKISDGEAHAIFARDFDHDTPVAQPAPEFPSGSHYSALVYSRSAAIMETMQRVYGARVVEDALRTYATRFRFKHPRPDDLIATFAEKVGEDAAANLRTALFEKGWVDYVAESAVSDRARDAAGIYDRDGKRETVAGATKPNARWDGWVLVARRGTLSFPVDVEFTAVDGSVRRVRWDGKSDWVRLPYAEDKALRAVVVDPDHTVLLDEKLVNNHILAQGQRPSGTKRTFERVTYWASVLFQVLGP